jgi:hypothetical protein
VARVLEHAHQIAAQQCLEQIRDFIKTYGIHFTYLQPNYSIKHLDRYKIWVSKSCSKYEFLIKSTTADDREIIVSVDPFDYYNLTQHHYDFIVFADFISVVS